MAQFVRDDLLDEIGAEAATLRLGNRGPAAFDPFDLRQRIVDLCPTDSDAAASNAERAEFRRIGGKLMDREPQRQRIVGRQFGMRPDQFQRMVFVAGIRCQFDLDHRADRRGAPLRLGEQIMRGRKRTDAPVEPFGEFIEIVRPAPRERNDREYVGERVLDSVIELTRERIADRVLLLEPADRAAILQRLLRQQSRHEHQQAGDREAEQQRDHRH